MRGCIIIADLGEPVFVSQSHTGVPTLRVNEVLDIVEPSKILLLFLHVHIVGNKQSKRLVNAPVFEVALHEDLEILIQSAERWAGVEGLGGM